MPRNVVLAVGVILFGVLAFDMMGIPHSRRQLPDPSDIGASQPVRCVAGCPAAMAWLAIR